MDDREQRIRERAHSIWEGEGRPDGREREHWLRAEQEVGDEPLDPGEGSAAGLQGEGMLASPGSASDLPPGDAEPNLGTGTRKRSAGAKEGRKPAKASKPAPRTRK